MVGELKLFGARRYDEFCWVVQAVSKRAAPILAKALPRAFSPASTLLAVALYFLVKPCS